jgi:protein gp37
MRKTKIRWADDSWNPMVGCTVTSPGCDNCYAETIAESPRFARGFPTGFTPTFHPDRLGKPASWRPGRVFVNSMSDVHHADFAYEQVAAVYDAMLGAPHHDYLVLTKRPHRMRAFMTRWLEQRELTRVPEHIWIGTSIESDAYTFRARILASIPATVRFLSCEPLITAVPSLNLDGIDWVIVGGESGSGHRPMDPAWAWDIYDLCDEAGVAMFYKQGSHFRTEANQTLPWPIPSPVLDSTTLFDVHGPITAEPSGARIEQFPLPHPAIRRGLPGFDVAIWRDHRPSIDDARAAWKQPGKRRIAVASA